MNKVQLAHRLAKRLHITDYASVDYLNALSDEVGTILADGETITIQNFGVFAPWHQTARPGRNPKNGIPHDIPARTSVKFKPGKLMLEKLNLKAKIVTGILLLSMATGCSKEDQPDTTEWVPVEIRVESIEQLEVSPMGTKAGAAVLPTFVKTEFQPGDQLTVTVSGRNSNGLPYTIATTNLIKQSNNSWTKSDGSAFILPAGKIGAIFAEYGTPIKDDEFGTTDYLYAVTDPVYNASSKTMTCSLNFEREEYSCLHLEIEYLPSFFIGTYTDDNGIEQNATYVSAAFIMQSNSSKTTRVPITDNVIEVFYNGTFTAKGIDLEIVHEMGGFDELLFLPLTSSFYAPTFNMEAKKVTNVRLSIP